MIRELTVGDLPLCPPLGQEFYATGAIPGKMVPEIFVASWTNFLETGVGVVLGWFEGDELLGVIGALKYNDPCDGVVVAAETFWFVRNESRSSLGGLRLLDAYEDWARRIGAGRIGMIHLQALAPETLEKLYLRKGYTKLETHFIKSL